MKKWTPLLTFILGAVLGVSGLVWQWLQSGRETRKQELDTIERTTEFRKQENDLYAKIIALSNEYLNTQGQFSKTPSEDLRVRIAQQNSQLEIMKDDFTTLETKLARVENRAPRTIILTFHVPEPPTGLSGVVN